MARPVQHGPKQQRGSSSSQHPLQQQHPRKAAAPLNPSLGASENRQEWLAKALASSGVASRRACIDLVKQGKVQVNGAVITDPATKVDLTADALFVDGRRISAAAASALCYFAVNKPAGYICSNVSKQPGKRAVDLLQPWLDSWQLKHKGQLPPRLYTVGRLDVATSGLIFITNDGDWANQVIHPSANITKEYWVTLPEDPTEQQLKLLRAGTVIEGVHVAPKLVKLRQSSSNSTAGDAGAAGGSAKPSDAVQGRQQDRRASSSSSSRAGSARQVSKKGRCVLQLDVSEGKKHEVRLLVAAAGLELLQLKRVRVGGFVMPHKLQTGQYMELSPTMRAKIFSAAR